MEALVYEPAMDRSHVLRESVPKLITHIYMYTHTHTHTHLLQSRAQTLVTDLQDVVYQFVCNFRIPYLQCCLDETNIHVRSHDYHMLYTDYILSIGSRYPSSLGSQRSRGKEGGRE